jgi:prevent-host-death family protein
LPNLIICHGSGLWFIHPQDLKPMSEIEAAEAKNGFSALLDRVERGEEVVITREGRAVAKLVPVQHLPDREQAKVAEQRIRERAAAMNLGPFDWEEWKRYRDEGRR